MSEIVGVLYSYDEKAMTKKNIDDNCNKLSLHKKNANRSQAQHIDIKLLALGLGRRKSKKSQYILLGLNQSILRSKIKNYDEIVTQLQNYQPQHFPDSFNQLIDKLANCEHNRWNAMHYLYGWQHNQNRNDNAKQHPCLLPMAAFDTDALKETYQYDLQSIINISKYLAYIDYELVAMA